ncbi:hypothetical protein J416_04171 [Gracilibacillus halophilus YIM-C55.5]|uniref:Uncharacterized protein n=1 Tax=Gracilibacillus halophilus YIM-C55.5 TaxID=1308866 RepID=N4WTP5_9BACI|nr:hypothetical protein [Gracilibacillus halophilus]ENH97730.1 hypothetical protein J416_04171 [Gracilibacillus halophilus YIM-C55.5]
MNAYKITPDEHLVELAGYHAYLDYQITDEIVVSGETYTEVNVNYDSFHGLDALTVQNISTKEYTVIYVGTNADQTEDLVTDFDLLTGLKHICRSMFINKNNK